VTPTEDLLEMPTDCLPAPAPVGGALGAIDMRLGFTRVSLPALAAEDMREAPREARESREFSAPWLSDPRVVRRLIAVFQMRVK
jgi:hypothetical protein